MRTLLGLTILALVGTATTVRGAPEKVPGLAELQRMTARFVPVDVTVDTSKLPPNEQLALRKMIEAAKIFDAVYLRQVSPMNETWLSELVRDESPLGRARLHYFRLNAGPWSSLDEDRPFLPGVGPKPEEANFYPADATRDQVE
ncbi:MAG TPA: hypothetical protein VHE61_00310, partial [Opitutaceae bacterium]|nr:hypothetical protein [Opitutaceae bacterium]